MTRGAFLLLLLSPLMTSCVLVWGLDPAEELAHLLEAKARDLANSDEQSLTFDFVPCEEKLESVPRFNGEVTLRVFPTGRVQEWTQHHSTISVCGWFGTGYHSRFVDVETEMQKMKAPGEAFRIVLIKSGDRIVWADLQ